jgi:hypothetical protein
LRCGAGSRLLGQGSGCGVAAGVAGSVRMGVCARWRPQVCAEGLECAARVPLTNADASQEPAGSALGVRVLDNRLGCEPRADSPSFYQGVYSAVVYSGTKNNNKMHTLCCRNVPSTASASSELHAQASAVWLANPEKRCPCPALCMPRRAPHRLTNPSTMVRLSHHTPTPEPIACGRDLETNKQTRAREPRAQVHHHTRSSLDA